MSRIGRQIIKIPEDIKLNIDNELINVIGPKGELNKKLLKNIKAEIKDNNLIITNNSNDPKSQRYYGLMRTLIANMIIGVKNGYNIQLELNGIGYKANVDNKNLILELGFSHTVKYPIPKDIDIKIEKNIITVSGCDKQIVGQVAAEIRSYKKPEPYKGKGIKYINEIIRRKAGKAATATTTTKA